MYSSLLCLIASVYPNLYVNDIHAVLKILFFKKKGTQDTVTMVHGGFDRMIYGDAGCAVNRGASFVFLWVRSTTQETRLIKLIFIIF